MSNICQELIEVVVATRPMNLGNTDLRWDASKVTDEFLLNLTNPNSVSNLKDIVSNTTIRTSIETMITKGKKSILPKEKNQRAVNISLATIMDTIESITDIASNNRVELKSISSEITDKDGNTWSGINVPYAQVAQVIAKKYLNSVNLKIAKGDPATIAANELKQGEMLLQPLIDAGIITVTTGNLPYNRQQFTDGKKIKDNIIPDMKVIVINPNKITDENIIYAKGIAKLLAPTREVLPSLQANKTNLEISKAHGVNITNGMKETFDLLAKGSKRIHPLFVNILKNIKSRGNENKSTKTSLQTLTVGYGSDIQNTVFGVVNPLNKIGGLEESQAGIARAKAGNIIGILDNLQTYLNEDNTSKDLHFDYFGFRTGRSLANQNIFNAQTDKQFSRAILASEPVEITVHSIAFQKVIGSLVEDYGFTDILKYVSKDHIDTEGLTDLINSDIFNTYKELFVDNDFTGSIIPHLDRFNKIKSKHITSYSSLYDKIKGTSLAYEVITGLISKEPKITITHDVAPDASGSGLFINLLQATGQNPINKSKVDDMLEDLGFLPNSNGEFNAKFPSLYNYVAADLREEIEAGINTEFSKDFNLLTKFKPDLNTRELAKMPVMTMGAYSQSRQNAKLNIADELATQFLTSIQGTTFDYRNKEVRDGLVELKKIIYNHKNISSLNEQELSAIVKWLDPNTNDTITYETLIQTPGVFKVLRSYFGRKDGIAEKLVAITEQKVKDDLFQEDLDIITDIYKVIEDHLESNHEIKTSEVKIISPQVLFDLGLTMDQLKEMPLDKLQALTKKYGLPLTKRVELINPDESVSNIEVLNQPSFIVSTTHMIDGAIQHLALNISIKEYYKKYGKYPGVIPIHDANNSDPLFAEINDKNYIKAVFEVNSKWDKKQMLLLMAKSLGLDITAPNTRLNQIQEFIDKTKDSKQEKLDTIVENLNKSQYEKSAKVYGYKQTTEFSSFELNKYLGIQDLTNLPATYVNMYREIVKFIQNNPHVNIDLNSKKFFFSTDLKIEAVDLKGTEKIVAASKLKFLYHEIIHAHTVGYIDTNSNSAEVVYLSNSLNKLHDKLPTISKIIDDLYPSTELTMLDANGNRLTKADYIRDRFNYILGSDKESNTHVIEAVAVLAAEPDMQQYFVEVVSKLYPEDNTDINKETLFGYITRLISKIKNFILSPESFAKSEDKEAGVQATEVLQVVHKILDISKENKIESTAKDTTQVKGHRATGEKSTENEQTKEKETRELANEYKIYLGSNDIVDPFSSGTAILNQYARAAIMLSFERYGKDLYDGYLTKGHISLMRTSPIYREVVSLLQGVRQNRHIQQIINYMNLDNFKDQATKTKLLAKFNTAVKERNKLDSTFIRDLTDKLTANFTDKEIAEINTVYAKSGIFTLTYNTTTLVDLLANDPTVVSDKDNLSIYIKNYISTNKITPKESLQMQGVADIYISGKVSANAHTDNIRAYSADKTRAYMLETLATLYALEKTNGIDVIRKVQAKSPEIHTEMVSVATAIKAVLSDLETKLKSTEAAITANIVSDVFKENYQIMPVDLLTYNKGNYNEDWKVLRAPKVGQVGLVYRVNMNTAQPGLATNNNFNVDGIVLEDYIGKKYTDLIKNNAVTVYMGKEKATKILFTQEEKIKLGLVENPAHSLYRTYSHLMFLNDTQPIRDLLITKAFTRSILDKTKDATALVEEIKNPDVEHAWFLKLNGAVAFNDLPKEVREKYEPVNNITNMGQMASQITHVRKDIAPWLVGYSEPELFQKNYKLNRVANVFKKLVALQKVHWVIVNPVKIMKDGISNATYLMSRNISLLKIMQYGSKITAALPELSKLQNDLVAAKLFAASDPGNASKAARIATIEKQISDHPFAFIIKNGYVSSISTDLILKDSATVTGLENDIENFLNKLVRDNKGDLNTIGKFISKAGKIGVSVEDGLNIVGNILKSNKYSKGSGKILEDVSAELSRIKDKEDVAKYLMQFMAAPGSEAVKLGSASIQSIEVISKTILHMHLKDIGKSENEAIEDVTNSFFDYTVNMPESMKVLSDYIILLFPTFWARIQRVIMLLGRDHPVSLATAYAVAELLGMESVHVVGSNLVTKFDDGSIINAPQVTLDAFFASNIIPFL